MELDFTILSIANYLTFIRIFVSPIFLLVYARHEAWGISPVVLPYVLLFLWGVNELSDLLDGYVARRLNQVTDLGKVLDPMADSISRISIYLTFTSGPVQLPMLLVFVIFYRDAMVSTLRTICALRGFALAARRSGKLKAVIQALSHLVILLCMIPHSLGYMDLELLQKISFYVVLVAAIYTVFSAVDYIYANREHVRKLLTVRDNHGKKV